jgi:hypothetical protein
MRATEDMLSGLPFTSQRGRGIRGSLSATKKRDRRRKSHNMSELPAAERCETCRFYQGRYELSKLEPTGNCFRYPPIRIGRPIVAANDRECGEWRPTTEPSQ